MSLEVEAGDEADVILAGRGRGRRKGSEGFHQDEVAPKRQITKEQWPCAGPWELAAQMGPGGR